MSGFYKQCRAERSPNDGGILLYVRDNITPRLLTEYKVPEGIACMFVELNVRNKSGFCAIPITLIRTIPPSI